MSHIDLVALAHHTVAPLLREGDIAIDATVGNGHDTLFLTHCIGDEGHVYGFDIQHSAIVMAQQRLMEHGVASRATLIAAGHETMMEHLPARHCRQVSAVMFNLGYLPGADKRLTTSSERTLQALEAARVLLAPGGIITVVIYTGHPGGREEADAAKQWAAQLDRQCYRIELTIPHARHTPPELLVVRRSPPSPEQKRTE